MNNILILIPDELRKPMGGMGEQARNLLACFPIHYKFTVIGSANADEYEENNIHFYPVMKVNTMNGNPDPLSDIFLNQSLFIEKTLSIDFIPDIIHAFDWSTFWAGRILAKHFNKPLVVTVQLSIDKHIGNTIHPLQRMQFDMACSIELSGLIEADRIVQVSESYANLFHSFLLPKTTIIHNGINLSHYEKYNHVKLPGIAKTKLVYIGRFADMKNIQTLVKCTIPKEIDLIFIGDGRGGNSELYDLVVNLSKNIDNVHFVGGKYGQEKINWLCSSDAVIIPSIHEPFGIVALECLASKSILLSSFVNGMGDFLSEDCAINCGTTKESIEHSFQTLLHLTNEQKQSYIDAGLKVCKEHDWSLQAKKMAKVYEDIIN